jgi:hypothetical protein
MFLSPAGLQFRTVHLLARGAGVSGRYDGIELINDDRPEVTPQAGALSCTPGRKIEKILVPVCPHHQNIDEPCIKKP